MIKTTGQIRNSIRITSILASAKFLSTYPKIKNKIKDIMTQAAALFYLNPGRAKLVLLRSLTYINVHVCEFVGRSRRASSRSLSNKQDTYVNAHVHAYACRGVIGGPQEERPWAPHAWLPASQLSLVHKRSLCFCALSLANYRDLGAERVEAARARTFEGRDISVRD